MVHTLLSYRASFVFWREPLVELSVMMDCRVGKLNSERCGISPSWGGGLAMFPTAKLEIKTRRDSMKLRITFGCSFGWIGWSVKTEGLRLEGFR